MSRAELPANLRSEIPELGWPASLGPLAAELLGLLYQIERTEWWAPERLRKRQLQQLDKLARYAAVHSEFYRERLRGRQHAVRIGA
jgi:hypothetical protein